MVNDGIKLIPAKDILAGDEIVHPLTGRPTKVHSVGRFPQKDSVRIEFMGQAPAAWLGADDQIKLNS